MEDTAPGGAPGAIRVMAMMECYSITGPAKNLLEFARRARPAVDLSIVAFQRLDSPTAFIDAAARAGIPVDVIAERRRFDPRVPAQLRAALARRNPHIVQSHNSKSHLLARMLRLARSRPWVAFHHGYTDRDLLDRLYNRVGGWALRGASHVVTVCGPFSLELQRRGVPAARISVRHNMVGPFIPPSGAEVEETKRRLGLPPEAKILLAAGRLSREKGHADLVEAAAILRRLAPSLSFRLVLAGDGPERDAIRRRIDALGLGAEVALAGHQAVMTPFYAMADAAILPSHREGSPNALLEAMAAGLPVVATSVGGVPEIAAHRVNALLVPPGDPQAMAAAVAEVLRDGVLARRLGVAAVQAAAGYTPESYFRSIIRLYRGLLAPEPSAGRCASAFR